MTKATQLLIPLLLLMLPSQGYAQPVTLPEDDAVGGPEAHQPLTAKIVSGHEQVDGNGQIKVERSPFEVYDRIKLDATQSTGAKKHLWGVFVDFDVSPDDMAGRAPQSVIDAVRTVEDYGGRVSLPVNDRGGIVQEYDNGTVLDLLPIPGTYYVTLTVIADNEGDQVQAVIRVNSYPGQAPRPPPDPDEPDDPDKPDDPDVPDDPGELDTDFSDNVADWIKDVPAKYRGSTTALADLCKSFADDDWANTKNYLNAKFGIGAAVAVGNTTESVEAWQPFFQEMSKAFDKIQDVSLEEYKAAYVSVGKGLEALK